MTKVRFYHRRSLCCSTEILQTDFVSNVSHEFKTPINAIEGYTMLLQSTDNIDEVDYYGNENMMHHVWSNIIGNAVKFSPEGGQIKIRLRKKEGKILFVVEDTGPGISDEAKKHLFDKFYQADTSHKEDGNGLGLALVKRILILASGEISAENIDTGGCRFTVTLTAN